MAHYIAGWVLLESDPQLAKRHIAQSLLYCPMRQLSYPPTGFQRSHWMEDTMKRIILCADGTWNEPERIDKASGRPQPTNVLKVARAVLPRSSTGVEQVVYYHEGVGTLGRIDKWTGGAFGRGMEKNVRSLYRFLVNNYAPGDELKGPALFESATTTVLVREGEHVRVTPHGWLDIRLG